LFIIFRQRIPECWLIQVDQLDLYNGCKTAVVVQVKEDTDTVICSI